MTLSWVRGFGSRTAGGSCFLRTAGAAAVAGLLVAFLAGSAGAQQAAAAPSVAGRVSDGRTGEPVQGVFLRLMDGSGEQVGGDFSSAAGLFRLEAPAPGPYSVVAQRLGYRSDTTALRLGAGQAAHRDLTLRPEILRLSELHVTTRRRCRSRPGATPETYVVWRETGKALRAAAWTARTRRLRLARRSFARVLNPGLEVVRTLGQAEDTTSGAPPFLSASPELLAREGYAHGGTNDRSYYAPDATVLLSDGFADGHCFRLTREDAPEPGWLGLAFEPVPGRHVPEIEGVLWVDPATGAPLRLTFGYRHVGLPVEAPDAGGSVDFFHLASGPWLIRSWRLRMPVVVLAERAHRPAPPGTRILWGYKEVGGEVTGVLEPDGSPLYEFGGATLSGQVVDSTLDGPLAGAVVRLMGTGRSVRAGPDGRFELPDLAAGTYRVVYEHPRLDSLGWSSVPVTVRVPDEGRVTVELAVPAPARVLAGRCEPPDGGALTGRVILAATGEALPGARVGVAFRPAASASRSRPRAWRQRLAHSDSTGRYAVCGLPPSEEVRAAAEVESRGGSTVSLRVPAGELLVRDLPVGPPSAPAGDSAATGDAAVSGHAAVFSHAAATGARPRPGRSPVSFLPPRPPARGGPLPPGPAPVRAVFADTVPPASPGGDAASGRSVLAGTVVAAEDGRPLPSAAVTLGEGEGVRTVTTDSAGRFLAAGIPAGPLVVEVRYLGFASRTARILLAGRDTLRVTLRMETSPVPLPALSVSVRGRERMDKLAGFRERRERGIGHFVDREAIEKTPGDMLSGAFRGLPGVHVVPCGGLEPLTCRRLVLRGRTLGGGGCPVGVYLDGVPHPLDPHFGINEIPKMEIGAIEIYSGAAEVPSEYAGPGGLCGVVLLWTRTGQESG